MFFQVAALHVDPGLQIGALIIAFGLAIVLHEVAHGYVALRLGDPTAQYAGRLTLNPIKHIDIWGSVLIPFMLIASGAGFVFGWAKPVPVNYYNLRYGKWGPVLVALAGPATNFILVVLFGVLARLSPGVTALPFLFGTVASINSVLMFFNLLPVPPLDGSRILYLFLENRPDIRQWLDQYGFFVFLALIILGGGVLSAIVFRPAMVLAEFFSGLNL